MAALVSLMIPGLALAQTFVHPGALNTQADFDRIKAKVATGEWPWYDSYVTLCNDGLSSLGWTWGPVSQITRGGGGGNNFSRSQKDAIAIYCLALRYRISGDARYAEKAIEGMDRWSSTMTAGPNGDNWGLAAGLCGYEFAVAGETLRGYPGWSQASIDRYKSFLGYFANANINFMGVASLSSRSNWLTDNAASLAACGVFCDNTAWFNQAINYYKYGRTNGQVHIWSWFMHPEGIVQMEESGRDQAHVQDAISSMAALCEIANSQGIDLYGYDNNRFLRAAEYFAKFNSWVDVPYRAYYNNGGWTKDHWETNLGYGGRGAFQPVWEMLNAHFVKQGIHAPYTAGYAASRRPSGNVGNWNSPDVLGYDTLTHYQEPPATDSPPSGLMANFSARQATLSWFGSPRATSYNLKRSTVKGGPYTTIATTNAMTANYVDDAIPGGQAYYYVVSAMTPSGETANSPEVIGSGCATRYDFEGDASDSVGTFPGTLACSGNSGLPGFTGGHGGGQAISFNGINQYVQLPFGTLTHQDLTVSAWIYWSGGNAWQRVFDTGDTNTNRNMYLTVSDGSRMKFYISDGWHDYDATLYGPVPALNTWMHVAVTVKAGSVTLYQNGVAVDSKPVGTYPLFGQTYTYIGKSLHNDPYFSGAIDDFRIYNGALSGADIYALGSTGSNHAPKFVSDPFYGAAAQEYVAYSGQSIYTKASDQDGGPLVFTKLSGPSWLSVAPNGALSGTPSKGDVGTNRINVRVTDTAGATDDATLYITVNNVNQAPTWSSSTITAPSITRDSSYTGASLATSASDEDITFGDTLTFSKVSGPAWLTVATDGALSGTPQGSDVGLNSFSVRVTDASGLSANATLNITVLPYSLRSQYSFESNLNDSISGYTGAASGSPTYGTGRDGNAISLNGSSDFVSLPAAAINFKEITIATWVYWNGGSNNQRIFDFGNSTSQYLELCPNTGGGMRFETVYGGTVQQINYASALPVGRWVHLAVTLGGSGGTLYVDGTAVATNSNLTIRPLDFSPLANYIGKSQWGADPLWNGKFDDFRIYNYALSASEITGLIGSIAPLAPSGLSATGGNGFSQITLSWSAAVGATSYNVKRATTSGGPYTTLYSGSATTYTDTTGTPGVTYYYIVTAVDAGGESVASNPIAQFANGTAPRAYLRLDESSGTTASDSSGNGWNATLVGGATWAAGKINNAVSLSGTTNYATIPSGVVAGMTTCTVSAWVKLNSATNNTRIFDFGTGTASYMELCPKTSSNGFMRYEIVSGGTVQQINTTYSFPVGVWTHVAFTLSGSTGTLYINGASVGTNTGLTLKPSNLGTTTLNYLGKSQWSNDPYLNGSIDEFQIYPRALSSTEVTALATSIPAPTVSIAAGDAQATLSWGAVANATGYNIKRSSTSGGPYTTVQANVSGTSFTDTSLLNSAGYYYVVTALNGPAESAYSTEVTTTPVGAPPVPTGLQATSADASVSLTWTSSYGATSYKILRSTTSGSGFAQVGTSTTASYADTGVTNGTTYFYKVSAIGPNGESASSTEASATPLALPAAPTGLTATGSNGAVTLTWTASVSATSYNVKSTTTSGSDYSVVATTSSTSFVDTGLTNGAPVYYVVSAINAIGEGSNSSEVNATPIAPPAAPIVTVSSGSGVVGIQWSPVSGATSYSVKRSGTSGGPYTVLTTGATTSYLDTSVTNGSVYYYVVTASNAGGEGSASAEGVAKPSTNALRTFLRFDEQSGSFAGDSTGNGWNGNLVGGSTWAAGKINTAVSFSGSTNYATLPGGLLAGVTDFTVSTWVKLNTANNTRIFDFGTGTSGYMELCPKNSNNGFLRYEIVSGGTVQQINTTYTFPTGVWTHVALTQSGSTGTLYVNGTQVGTNTGLTLKPSNLGTTTLNYIGKSQWSNDPYLNGSVDEFQIYGRALSASEIASVAGTLAAPTGLTATAGYSQVTCTWNTVAGATSYNLKRSYVSGGPYTTLATLTGTTFTDTSTTPQSPYYYVVTAVSGLVESANSTQATATPLMAAPVVSSATTASGTNGVSFSYQIAASNFPTSFSASGLPAGLSVNSTTGLISGTPSVSGTFNATISASNSGGTGNATLTITLQPPAPVINSALSVTGTSGSAFSYTITASNSPTSFAASGLPAGLSINTTSGVISGTPSVTGTFSATISASNGGGTGSATLNLLLISGSFGAPTGLSATAGVNAVSLAWTPVAGASSYKIKRSLTSGSNYTTVATGLASPAYSDSGLPNRTVYFYVVSAVTSGGTESANSSEAGATPMPPLTWIGTGSDANWLTGGNWSSQPVTGNLLSFEGNLRLSNTNNYSANTQFGGITFNSGSGAFSLNGSAINLAGDIVNSSGAAQTINLNLALSGANRTINTAAANLTVAGVISQSGGTYGLIKTGTGELTLSGTNTFAGGVVLDQGYVNAENRAALGTGTLTLAGGTLRNLTGPIRILSNRISSPSGTTGFVRAVATDLVLHGDLSGSGTVDICGTYNAAGMRLSGDNSGFTGTLIVSGPNLRLDTPESASANAAWIVGVSGTGGLQLNAPGTTNTFELGSLSGNGCIAGHFTFSSSQIQTLSVGALGTDSTFSGTIINNAVNNAAFGNADGAANNVLALTKVGAGTLTLAGNSSYTGPTIVNGGTLKLNGTLSGTSSITVNGGASIAGTGAGSGPLTVASGGTIAPGDSGAGTLSANGGLTLNDGSILNVELVGTGNSDKLALTGGYSASGVTTVNVSKLAGFAGVGTYPILTGATGISTANFALGMTPAGYTAKLSAAGDTLSVVISVPDAPAGLAATAGQGQVSLSWGASAGATSYTVLRSTLSGSGYAQVADGSTTATNFADTTVADGTTYYYVVTATNLGGTSASSNQASVTTIPATPTGLTTSSSNGQVALSWNAVSGADGYSVKRAIVSGGPYTTIQTALTATSYSDTSAANGTTYYYIVTATNLGGESEASPEAAATPVAPPVAPSGLAATAGNATASLTWSPVTGASGYRLKRATVSGGPYALVSESTSTSFGDSGLTNGTTYYYVVSAYNAGGESANSTQVSAAPQAAPNAPTGLAATAASSSKINLAWSTVSGATSYTVKRATVTGGPYTTLASGLTATSFNDTGLTSTTTYSYVVTATGTGGESGNSTEASATTTDLRVKLAFDETSGTTATDSAGDGYHGTLVNGPTFATGALGNAVDLDGTNDHVTVPSGVLSGLSTYSISVWVKPDTVTNWSRVFDFGTGTTVNMFLTPKNAANGKVRFAITTGGGNGEQRIDGQSALIAGAWSHVVVTWSGNTGILYVNGVEVGRNTGMTLNPSSLGNTTQNYLGRSQYADPYFDGRIDDFRIYTRALGASEIAATTAAQMPLASVSGLQATPASSAQINLSWTANPNAVSYSVKRATTPGGPYTTLASGITAASYSNTGLNPGTAYYYVVSATNAGGEGANSAEASATTLPAAPATLSATTVSSSQLNLAWSASTGATSYTVKRSATSGGAYTTLVTGVTGTSYSDTGLTAGATWYYVVSASNTGESANSTEASATTLAATPSGLTATAVSSSGLNLSWTAAPGATGYDVKRSTSGSGPFATIASGVTATAYSDAGLNAATTYYYVVAATNVAGSSANSAAANATTLPLPPATPTGLAANPGNAQVSLTWSTVSGATGYNVKRATVSGGSYTVIASNLASAAYTDTGLTNGTTYYYVVNAANTGGTSGDSAEVNAVPTSLPGPWVTADLGTTGLTGSAEYASNAYTVKGAGSFGGSTDGFRYLYQQLSADGSIIARISTLGDTGTSARVGIMMRDTLDSNARMAALSVTGSGAYKWERRTATGGNVSNTNGSSGTAPNLWVRLVRVGNTVTASRSTNGTSWTTIGSATVTMASSCYVGISVSSGSTTTLNTSVFDNVTVVP